MARSKRPVTLPEAGRVTVRFDVDTRADLSTFALAHGLSVAEVVRRVVTGSMPAMHGSIAAYRQRETENVSVAFTEAALVTFGDFTAELERARLDWLRIGVNANQLARAANTNGADAVAVQRLCADVAQARARLDEITTAIAALLVAPVFEPVGA